MNGPHLDGENEPVAFTLDDVHGYRDLFRRIGWTAVLIAAVIAGGLVIVWVAR